LKIAMAQINPVLGDLEGNAKKISEYMTESWKRGAEIVAFPEMAVTGYPPQDLLYEKPFVMDNKRIMKEIVEGNAKRVAIIGFIDYDAEWKLYNAAAVYAGNKHVGTVHKTLLPTYDVFDEDRYFEPANKSGIKPIEVAIAGKKIRLGIEICEDLWDQEYNVKVTDLLVKRGAELLINISASPFYIGKWFERQRLLKEKAIKHKVPFFYVNLVGGQDELVFDGQSLAVDANGNLIAYAKPFEEDLVIISLDLEKGAAPPVKSPLFNREKEMFNALALGVRDYFWKTGFRKAVVGMSGGIDSSLTTCIAVEALGKENVIGVSMPSRFSSDHSRTDAEKLAENLGICFIQFPVQNIVECYERTLEKPLEAIRKHFGVNKTTDDPVADENVQPRVRGNSLMDISNRLKDLKILVLNTGNKTELALGYCTLYGDMAGGLGALGDVSKLEVYRLAEHVNIRAGRQMIPENVFKKKPSPELREEQFDPFDFNVVGPMVDEIIEKHKGRKELIEIGYPGGIVDDIYRRLRRAEYKRRQASPCIKITKQAFGIGWKMPIVNKYKG
jgi:NAD+ synthase (glutamine-hydrolysing)